jgi:hypothetical protein
MCRDVILTHETVGVETFFDLVVEPCARRLERDGRDPRKQPCNDEDGGR